MAPKQSIISIAVMSVSQRHGVVEHFRMPYLVEDLEKWASEQREYLSGPPNLAFVFAGYNARPFLKDILEAVRIYAQVPVLIGSSAIGLVANGFELENDLGFSVGLYHLPNTQVHGFHFDAELFEEPAFAKVLIREMGEIRDKANAWMLFASPESLNSDSWLPGWDEATGGKTTVGGFASLNASNPGTLLFKDGAIYEGGAVALALEGGTTIEPLLVQGCRPVGDTWTVTRVENNIIHQIGNRPILEVLRDTLESMSPRDQKRARGNIFIGVVHDEYKSRYKTGDFLVRNLAAIDPKTGSVAIATSLRIGQNLQFQIRDANSASYKLEQELKLMVSSLQGRTIYGACLCNCIGRGSSLFGVPDHDAGLIREFFPGIPVTGFFCNGEFGPVGARTLLHGYASSLAVFANA